MSYNGSGTFNINSAGQPVVTGTTITSTAFNLLTADLATGLSTAMTKDGQSTPTANIPMGTFKLTGLGAGTAATDAAQYGQLQAGATTIATVTGTDTYVGTLSPAIAAYATGNLFSFVAPNTNTGAATINLNSLGAKNITKLGSTALAAGDIVSGRVYQIEYDGTRFQLLNPSSVASFSAGSTGFTPSSATTGAVTLAGTLATTNGGTGLTSFTANQVFYASSTSAFAQSSNLQFSGTDLTVYGITVGRGAGAVSSNTAVGASALAANTSGSRNAASGWGSLFSNTTGTSNTVFGYQSGFANTTGSANSAFGDAALVANTTGGNNTALGYFSLQANTTASNNTAVGYQAGYTNVTGTNNTYTGWSAGKLATGNSNTAFGAYSAFSLTSGSGNTFYGTSSGGDITTGAKNTIIGSYGGNQGGLDIRTASNYIVLSDGDGNPRGIFDNSGRLLVGTTSSSGSIATFKGSQQSFIIRNGVDSDYNEFGVWDGASDGLKAVIKAEGGLGKFGTRTNSPMVFQTNDTERARIDSSGNLLVGATSTLNSSKMGYQFDGNAGYRGLFSNNSTGAAATHMGFYTSGTSYGSISSSTTGTGFNTSSDYRLKNTIAPMTGALDKVALLKPVTYKWNVDGSDGQGFIAHELAEVCPHAVTGAKDAVEAYTDEDGNEATRPVYQGIDTSFLVATLTAALQETKALIDTQAETINALTARIVALETK